MLSDERGGGSSLHLLATKTKSRIVERDKKIKNDQARITDPALNDAMQVRSSSLADLIITGESSLESRVQANCEAVAHTVYRIGVSH